VEKPLDSGVAATAVKANPDRLLTEMDVDRGVDLPPDVTATVTVPLVTIVPDHELVVPVPLTVLLPESVNFQPEKVAPVGALLTLQVTLPPRVTDEGEQLSVMTVAPPPLVKRVRGQGTRADAATMFPQVEEVVPPTDRPVCVA